MKRLASVALMILLGALEYTAAAGVISGTIKGPDGAPFRGGFVRAENLKTRSTMFVLSDKQGRYVLDNLAPGTYAVEASSTGYRAEPARRSDVQVADAQPVSLDFAMQKRKVLWSQLTKYQAGKLLPDGPGKDVLLGQCMNCHGFGKIGQFRTDYDGWMAAIDRMRQQAGANVKPEVADQVAKYLASVLGPDGSLPASPSDLPAYQEIKQEHDYFSDEALNLVYVDYELTRDPKDRPGAAHEDKQGNIWAEARGGLIRLNDKTGEVKVWRLPDANAFIHEALPTDDGSVWITEEAKSVMARFNPKTETFDEFPNNYKGPYPAQHEPNAPWPQFANDPGFQNGSPRMHTAAIDHQGNIWVSGRPLQKLDVKTGKYTNFPEAPDTYGIDVDHQGNVWFAEYNSRDYFKIGMVDPRTNQVKKWSTPDNGRPRRLKVAPDGTIWFAAYFNGYIARFDPKTEKFTTYKLPGPMPTPYGLEVDHTGNVWYTSMYTDVTGHIDVKTGKIVEYPSPYGERGDRDLDEDAEGRIWYGAQPYFKVGYFYVRDSKATGAPASSVPGGR